MKKLLLLCALGSLFAAGCGRGASDEAVDMASDAKQPAVELKNPLLTTNQAGQKPAPTLASSVTMNRSIIRSATLGLRVDKVDKAEKQADAILMGVQGYVENVESTDLASADPKITIRARIPVATFDATLDRLEALGVRLSKTVRGEDVTEKVVDFDARLKVMSAQEEVYRNLLRKAGDLSTSTALQDKLMALRGDIESITAQRKSLATAASLSTIEITLQQQASPVAMAQADPGWSSSAWSSAQSSATSVFRNLAIAAMWLLAYMPLWLPLAALAVIGRKIYRKRQSIPVTS